MGHGLFTAKEVEWLKSLKLERVDCYLRLIEPLKEEVRFVSGELKRARIIRKDQLLDTRFGISLMN